MRFTENRKLAYIVLIAVMLFSVVGMSSFKLLDRHADAEKAFMHGDMASEMSRCSEQAALIGQMSDMYLNDSALSKYTGSETAAVLQNGGYTALPAQVEELSAQLAAADDPNECIAVLTELSAAVEKTYTGVDMLNISEDDFRNIKLAYYDFKGALDIVSRDGDVKGSYTALARDFNSDIQAFPANLFAAVLNMDKFSTYGG